MKSVGTRKYGIILTEQMYMGVVLKVLKKYINRNQSRAFLENTKGKFFTVEHIKKDGSIRKTNARLGVKKHLKGVGLGYDPIEKELITVYDVQIKAYRTVNLKTLKSIKFRGSNLEVL